jgi:hypothetical protein
VAAAGWLAIGATTAVPLVVANRPTTVDAEFAFLRRTLPELPEAAIVLFTYPFPAARDTGLRDLPLLARLLGRPDLRWIPWDLETGIPPGRSHPDVAVLYYHQPSCDVVAPAGPSNRARCDQARRSFTEPVAEAGLPARTLWGEVYASTEVPVGLYRRPEPVPGAQGSGAR